MKLRFSVRTYMTLAAVLVVTAGMAPVVRQAITPLVSRSLGMRAGQAPVASPLVDLQGASASAAPRSDVELGSPLGNRETSAYSVGRAYSGFAPGKWEPPGSDDKSDDKSSRQSDRFDSFLASSLMSQRNNVFNSRGSRAAANVGSLGAGRDAAKGSGGRRAENAKGPAGSAAGGGAGNGQPKHADPPSASGGLFNEHTSGLPNLNGSLTVGNSPITAAALGPTVAVNPEPSTIFLFGTGLAAVARLLRRRLS